MLRCGARAPNFILPDADGRDVVLNDFHGQWTLIVFYPCDFSAVCTRQACQLRDAAQEFRNRDVSLVGINLQRPEIHKNFAQKHGLSFPLLWDRQKRISRRYGVLGFLGLYCRRAYFLIDPEGWIVFRRIEPSSFMSRSVEELLSVIDECQGKKKAEGAQKE